MARSLAERIFSYYPQIITSLSWLRNNPPEFSSRISDFESVVAKVNKILPHPFSANEHYREEANQLAKFTDHIPSLSEATAETTGRLTHNSPALHAYFQAKREFRWADEEFDADKPAKSAMGILLG